MTQVVESLACFVHAIDEIKPQSETLLLYRGHSDHGYKFQPSVFRKATHRRHEHDMLGELIALHPDDFSTDATMLERLVRAQHYSLPTRLLDVTWNPLVALYFSAAPPKDVPGEVIVIRVKRCRIKRYDSDTVSCLANLSRLSEPEKNAINFDPGQSCFNDQEPVDRLLQFIRDEKPYFRPRIVPDDLKSVFAIKPKLNNRRIQAQSGAFLLFGIGCDLESSQPLEFEIEKIRIDKECKDTIRSELDKFAINELTMFPEIDHAAAYIKSGEYISTRL